MPYSQIERWLERSKSAPLTIDIHSAGMLDILGPHSERVRCMDIRCLTWRDLATLSSHAFSSLRSLHVSRIPVRNDDPAWDLFPRATSLTTLSLVLVELPNLNFPLLVHLTWLFLCTWGPYWIYSKIRPSSRSQPSFFTTRPPRWNPRVEK